MTTVSNHPALALLGSPAEFHENGQCLFPNGITSHPTKEATLLTEETPMSPYQIVGLVLAMKNPWVWRARVRAKKMNTTKPHEFVSVLWWTIVMLWDCGMHGQMRNNWGCYDRRVGITTCKSKS